MKEYVLYGNKINEPDYMEDIIYTSFNPVEISKAKTLATKKGYIKFRVATHVEGSKPNFNDPKLINL